MQTSEQSGRCRSSSALSLNPSLLVFLSCVPNKRNKKESSTLVCLGATRATLLHARFSLSHSTLAPAAANEKKTHPKMKKKKSPEVAGMCIDKKNTHTHTLIHSLFMPASTPATVASLRPRHDSAVAAMWAGVNPASASWSAWVPCSM